MDKETEEFEESLGNPEWFCIENDRWDTVKIFFFLSVFQILSKFSGDFSFQVFCVCVCLCVCVRVFTCARASV